jgi:dTDP-4-amino-4,6-dideoxygalactose transaminase
MIPLFDLTRTYKKSQLKLLEAYKKCVEHGRFINGPEVKKLEEELKTFLATSNCIGVSSGTDALLTALMALNLEEGDEVLVTPFTFVASATSIVRAGLKPVFVDLAENSFHPSIKEYEAAWTDRTRGVLFVHLFGEPGDLTEIKSLCDERGAFLVEDCAQSMGSRFKNGNLVGTYGDVGTFSFFPAKNLGCFGDGGAVVTDNDILAQKIRMIRVHGSKIKYKHELLGGNFRLDTIQAAFLSVLLPELDNWIEKRRQNAQYYLENLQNIENLMLPMTCEGHSWNQFTLRTSKRDHLKNYLDACKIGSAIYYPIPLHRQKIFEEGVKLPNAEKICNEVISIPVYPGLRADERTHVVTKIRNFYGV